MGRESVPRWRTLLELTFLLSALVPCGLALLIVRACSINTPYSDEWAVVPLIAKLRLGGLTFSDLWEQHFEHRVLVLNLIILGLAKLGPWNTVREVFFGFGLNVLCLCVVWVLLRETATPIRGFVLVFSSALLFSAAQSQNLTWGWQLAWFLNNLLFLATVWMFWRWPGRLVAIVAGWLCLAIGSYATGTELAGWPVILFGMVIDKRWPRKAAVLWIVGAGAILGFYLLGLNLAGSGKYLTALRHPLALLRYTLGYLGSPFAVNSRPTTGVRYGALALSIGVIALYSTWRNRAYLDTRFWRSILPWLQIALFSVLNALVTAITRTHIELLDAAPRYATVANLIWLADGAMLALALEKLLSRVPRLWQLAGGATLLVAFVSLSVGYARSYRYGLEDMLERHSQMETAVAFLYDFASVDDQRIGPLLWNNIPLVRKGAATLKQLGEGPFQLSRAAYLRELAEKWQPRKGSCRRYPTAAFHMSIGDPALLKQIESGALQFAVTDPDGMSFEVDGTFLKQPSSFRLPAIVGSQALAIESKIGQYIDVYWGPSKSWGERKSSGFALTDGEGRRYFAVQVPPGVEAFRLDLHYAAFQPIEDLIAVDVCERR